MANTIFPVAPNHEQNKVAAFLVHETAKIDTLIEKQQQLIQLLKEKRQAVISHAVTKGLSSLTAGPTPSYATLVLSGWGKCRSIG